MLYLVFFVLTVIILFLVPSTDISQPMLSVLTPMIIAGGDIQLICSAEKLNTGYTSALVVSWRGPDMSVLEQDPFDDIRVSSFTNPANTSVTTLLSIDSLATSEVGSYACLVTMATPLLPHAVNRTDEQNITVRSMSNYNAANLILDVLCSLQCNNGLKFSFHEAFKD